MMITASEYQVRRARFIQQLGADSIAILKAAPEKIRTGDTLYPYRQESHFYYMTGFMEPEAVAVFIPGRKEGEYILFNQPRDPELEIWIGRRVGQEDAVKEYRANEAYPIEKLNEIMPKLLEGKKHLYFSFGTCSEWDKQVNGWLNSIRQRVRSGVSAPEHFTHVDLPINEMRLFKTEAEIQVLRHSVQLSAKAHVEAMKFAPKAAYEYEVEAVMWQYLCARGCRSWAYEPIIGGGANTCVLHYNQNNAPLKHGDLLLIDAGGEYQYYSSDITRTFPVSGKFSPEQRAVYELVLKSQKAAIQAVKPGNLWDAPQTAIVKIVTEGLVELGILKGSVDELIQSGAYKPFYMHRSGHWLGLDTHDVGQYTLGNGQWRPFEPGMVLTVEPGLYIPASKDVAPRWWNIGIRIEDDVLVTKEGCEVLSKDAPKEPDEIEALMVQ